MKKPELDLWKPFEFDYQDHEENITIYRTFVPIREDYETDLCHKCGEEVLNCVCADDNATNFPDLSSINLQSIIDFVPEEVELNEVKTRTYLDSGSYPTGYFIDFYYVKKVKANKEKFVEDTKVYEEKLAEYNKKMLVYEKHLEQEEIKDLELKLQKLKSKL